MITITRKALYNAIVRAAVCTSTDKTRESLTGVYFHYLPTGQYSGNLVVVAADGYRLCKSTLSAVPHAGHNNAVYSGAILPVAPLKDFCKVKPTKKNSADEITLEFVGAGVVLNGKSIARIEGNFPDYQCLIPRSCKYENILPAEFAAAALHMESFRKGLGYAGAVSISITSAGYVLATKDEEIGSTRWDIQTPAAAPMPYPMGANYKFLADMARASKGEIITAKLSAKNGPLLFTFDNVEYIIMPYMSDNLVLSAGDGADAYGETREYVDETKYVYPHHDFWTFGEQKQDVFPYATDLRGLETGPAADAIEYTCCQVVRIENQLDNYGTAHPEWGAMLVLGVSNPMAADDSRPTKSELMTTLNKERARIRREYKNLPATCAKELERLYKAFGNLQRKEWKQTTEKMNVTKDGALDYLGMKSARALLDKIYSLRPNAQPINVTAEFSKLNTKVTC